MKHEYNKKQRKKILEIKERFHFLNNESGGNETDMLNPNNLIQNVMNPVNKDLTNKTTK